MKRYLILGCSILTLGGAAYAATTDPVADILHSIVEKQVKADSLDSLSTENLSLKEITTHKKGNDFSTLVHPKYIDNQIVKEHQEEINNLNKRLQETTFETILSSFGSEKVGTIPDGDAHTGESFDRIGLEETYARLQKEGTPFFEAFFTAFPEIKQKQVEEHFNELLFVATYLGKWYDVSIGESSLWELMYFEGAELTADQKWEIDQVLHFAEELKANNYEALLSKNVGNTFKQTQVYSQFTNKSYSELIEWFVKKETGSTDYSTWFYDYFNGVVKMDTALTEEDNVGIWNRNGALKENLPYLLTQKPGSNLTLIESYRLLMIASGNDKEKDVLNAIRTIKNEEAFFYRTYDHKEEVDSSIGQLVLWAPNWNLLDETDDYAKNLLLPSENFSSHNANGAVGGYQYISLQQNGYDPSTIAHELGHSMNGLLSAGGEFLTTFIFNVGRNTGSYINTYADNENIGYGTDYPINSDVNEIQTKEDLVTMTKNSENFIYAMDAVIADVVLEMPLSEQVKYIRKVPINVDSGVLEGIFDSNTSFDAKPLTISELESMNLQSIDDLINHGLVIMEPDDTNNNILTNRGQGYGTSLSYSSYFLANGKFFQHTHRIINTIVSEDGWEGFKRFNVFNNSQSDWNYENVDELSINSLRVALNDPSVTYRSYAQKKYLKNRETVGKKGLKSMSYLDLKKTFENSIDDFYQIKQNLYKEYTSLTNSFKNDAFGYDASQIKEVSSYDELHDVVTADPKATISIISDFEVPTNAKEIKNFEGNLKGNGHTITNGISALFGTLNNATIESLILKDFTIKDQEAHTGILSNQAETARIRDVHVLNSMASIKQGVKYSIGGLLGEAKNSVISQCSSQGNEIVGSFAGGIVGYGENTSITDTYIYEGTVTGNEVGDLRVGGLAGNFISGTIKNTYSSADIKNGQGFIGSTYSYGTPSIDESNSFSIGNVDEDRLKFMEEDNNSKTYQNNYELSTATGKSSAGITKLDVKAIEETTLKEENFYTKQLGWNTENIWQTEKVAKGTLPYLRNSDPRNSSGYQEPFVFEWVSSVNDQSTILEGKVSQKATIMIYDEGTQIGQAETTEDGKFSIPIEPLMGNHQLKIVAKTNTVEEETYLQVQGTAPTIKGKKGLTVPVGEYGFKPEELLENVSDRYGEENLTYTVDTSKVNLGLPGEYNVIVTAANSIGRSSTIKVPVTLQDYNSIVFQGYGPQERFRLGLQTSNKKIRLVENTEFTTQLDSGTGAYIKIELYDRTGKLKKQASTNAEDLSEVLVKAFDQTSYEEGDLLDVSYLQHSHKMQFYQEGEVELPFGSSGKNQLFTIKNDELVRLTDNMVQTKEVTTEVGSPVEVEEFVDSVNEALSNLSVSYSLNSEFNPGKTGEQTNTLTVCFGEHFSREIPIKLTYVYDNNISIRCYREEERFILGLNEDNRTINFVTDTSQNTQLDSGSGEYLTITVTDKEGKQKYQMKANAEDLASKMIDSLNRKSYENGDIVHIKHTFDNKVQYYKNGEIKLDFGSCKKEEIFMIQNDELIRLTDDMVQTKKVTTEVGSPVEAEEFVASVHEAFSDMSIHYALKDSFNPGKTGEQTNTLEVSLGEAVTQEIPVKLNYVYENNLLMRGYASEERFILGLNKNNKTINFVTDSDRTTQLNDNQGLFVSVTVFSKEGKQKYQMNANGEDTPSDLVSILNGRTYEEGDWIQVKNIFDNKLQFYQNGEIKLDFDSCKKEELFRIQNDQLVYFSDNVIQTKEVTTEVGSPVEAKEFVASVHEAFSDMPVQYGLKDPFNLGKTGEQTNTLEVSLGEAVTQEIPVKLNYVYENNLSIHCYYEQERFILGLNKQNQTLNFVTDTSMDTPLDSGAGDYLTITVQDKEGKQKYQMQANAEDSPSQLINALNGKAYENGDHITVQHKNSGKIGLYVKGTLQLDYGNSQNSEEFVIQNNQLLQYDPEAINVTVKEGETTVGEAVEPNELIESGQSNYTYTFVKEPNYYQYGEQTVQIKVTDDQGKTTVVETTLVIKHESELTISTKDTTDERLTIKIDSTTHQLQGITDPKNTAAFSATSEPEVLVMSLYNQNNELRQMIALDGGMAPQDCMNELSKQTVEIGDYLTITSKEGVPQSLYREGTNVQTTNESTGTYQINAQWQFEPRKTPTPPDEGGNENSSATKIDADVLIEFSKDNTPVQPVDPNDPTIPVDPTDPINPIGGELMITYTSKLDFGTHKKGGTSWFAYGDRMQGNVPITPFVSIKDTRSTDRKGWSLTAQLETPFVNEKGQPLNGAELHFSHLYSGNGELNAPEVTEGDLVVDKAGVEIARATEKNGYGQHSIGLGKLQADNTTNGVELTIPKGIANDSGNYQATILYTLTADPTAAFKE